MSSKIKFHGSSSLNRLEFSALAVIKSTLENLFLVLFLSFSLEVFCLSWWLSSDAINESHSRIKFQTLIKWFIRQIYDFDIDLGSRKRNLVRKSDLLKDFWRCRKLPSLKMRWKKICWTHANVMQRQINDQSSKKVQTDQMQSTSLFVCFSVISKTHRWCNKRFDVNRCDVSKSNFP